GFVAPGSNSYFDRCGRNPEHGCCLGTRARVDPSSRSSGRGAEGGGQLAIESVDVLVVAYAALRDGLRCPVEQDHHRGLSHGHDSATWSGHGAFGAVPVPARMVPQTPFG